ncbi:hypothetical protein D3C72_1706780 [compost metagenome]
MGFQQVAGALQAIGTLGHGRGLPAGSGGLGGAPSELDLLGRGVRYLPDRVAVIGRVDDGLWRGGGRWCAACQHGRGVPRHGCTGLQVALQLAQAVVIGQVQPGGIGAACAIQITRLGDVRVGQAQLAFALCPLLHGGDGVFHQF